MTEKTIPLGKDPALEDPSGMNPADASKSAVSIENTAGNPDETVNLPEYEDVDGVEEGGLDVKTGTIIKSNN